MHNELKFPGSVLHVHMCTDIPKHSTGIVQDDSWTAMTMFHLKTVALFVAESQIDASKVLFIFKKLPGTPKNHQKLVSILFLSQIVWPGHFTY